MNRTIAPERDPAAPGLDAPGGFTLVEILVALFIMVIGFSSVFALFAAATALHKRATDLSTAAAMAESIFSQVELNLTTGIQLNQLGRKDAELPGYPNYRYDLELVPVNRDEKEVFVRLAIRWRSQGAERSIDFSTILARRISFKGRAPNAPGRR